MPSISSGSVVVDSWGRYIIVSLMSLDFRIGEMRRSSRAWSGTESRDVGWEVIKKGPGLWAASRSGLIEWVV